MRHLYGADTFINKMMEETFSNCNDDFTETSKDLFDFFNEGSFEKMSSLEDIFNESSTKFFNLEYSKETKCFKNQKLNLDFPQNWSIFDVAYRSYNSNMSIVVEISEYDSNLLHKVLYKLCPKGTRLYLIASNQGVYFACPRIEDMNFEDKVSKFFSLTQKDETEATIEFDMVSAA